MDSINVTYTDLGYLMTYMRLSTRHTNSAPADLLLWEKERSETQWNDEYKTRAIGLVGESELIIYLKHLYNWF